MEHVGLVYIDVDGIVASKCFIVNIVLNGSDFMVDEQLLPGQVTGKPANPIIHGDDIGIETADQIIQGGQRSDFSAG
ncbi:hypothetical protein SDC9_154155 [bioreactor metagenome]|uniref:Uncharacterized protein n=1 Tax=bioreactor metagenome TaxID=1076179 RepID=A0A645EXX4_9ZZZZ